VPAFRKLLIAALLVATGLAVAAYLGKPPSAEQSVHLVTSKSATPISRGAETAKGSAPLASSQIALLSPEPVAAANVPGTKIDTVTSTESHCALTTRPAVDVAPDFGSPLASRSVSTDPPAPPNGSRQSLARLRDEAPRPVGNEPRSPATIRREPQLNMSAVGINPAWDDEPYQVRPTVPATPVLPTSFAAPGDASLAQNAAYNESLKLPTTTTGVSPPPWTAPDENEGPRTHVIIDGDSLEKLAGRYLNDPRRGSEIYELNRELLANPDLLPIGAELKIPDRSPRETWDRQTRRLPDSNSRVREAAHSNLVPIRSIGLEAPIIPQAQLTYPMRAD
jgi:hypothetical protein